MFKNKIACGMNSKCKFFLDWGFAPKTNPWSPYYQEISDYVLAKYLNIFMPLYIEIKCKS